MSSSTETKSFAIRANLWMLAFTRNWLRVVLTVLAIYVTLPFAAPTLMELGIEGPGRFIYRMYTPFCHQAVFRSFFLYGEQAVYPRESTGTSLTPFEDYARELEHFDGVSLEGLDLDLLNAARSFLGNEEMGYKLTLCERDIFIYIALLTGGFIYAVPFVRRRLRPVPLWLYVFLGLGPIGLDGFSQLLGYPPFNFWPPRETLPVFRVVTGALFGFMNAWLAFPYLESAMFDTRLQIEEKLRRAGIIA
ncbi:MAG: hypothetical protein OHK0046_00920 [Anaerolineae bacterium]